MDSCITIHSSGKKLIAVALCVTAFVFLSFSVFAANPSTYNDYSATASNNGVQIKLRCVQLKSSSLGTSLLPGGMESVFFTTCEIINNNTDAAILNPILFDITITEDKTISHIYSYSSDLELVRETYFKIIPSSDFSYDGMIVVPPQTTLYFVGEICTTAQLNQTADGILDAGLRGVDFVGTGSSYIVGHGDYPYGSAIDMSPVIDAIDESNTYLEDIYQTLEYITNPSTHTITNNELSNLQTGKTLLNSNGVAVYSLVRPVINFIENDVSYNDYLETGLMSTHQLIDVVFDHYLVIRNTNRDESWALSYGVFNLRQSITRASGWTFITKYIEECEDSNISYMLTNINSSTNLLRCSINQRMSTNNDRVWLYPDSTQYIHIKFHRIYRLDQYTQNASIDYQFSFEDLTAPADSHNLTCYRSSGYDDFIYDQNEVVNRILRDFNKFIDSYNSVNNLDDIDDTAEDITDKSETAHTQEQTYFTQNAQAIEATGLSNYRFSTDQENGIGSVSHDFTLLWNALSGFNSVYIFSLTLSLALMVLRHAPSAIRSSRKNKEE